MISKLREVVGQIAEKYEVKIEKWDMAKIKLIEKHLDDSGDIELALDEIDKILDRHWDKDCRKDAKKILERK